MPLSTTKKLFRMLRLYHPEVPKDRRTLLQTPRTCISKPLNKGNYVHLGLGRGLLDQLHSSPETTVPEMHIQLHIDGMKIFKGSSQGPWPILARVRHPVVGQPFIVGVFSGPGKPDPLDDFLSDCVGELKDPLASSLRIPHTQNSVKMILDNVICDTPARCFVRQVKAHNGYYGCDRYVRRQTSDSDDDDELLYCPRQLLGWPTPPRVLQTDEQIHQVFSQSSEPRPSTSYREMPAPAPAPTTGPACSQQTQSDLSNVNFRLTSLENKVDVLAEQMVALNNSVRQLQATMTDAVSALERGATAADVGPSRLHLPLCTEEAYEDFVRRLTTEAELADKAACLVSYFQRKTHYNDASSQIRLVSFLRYFIISYNFLLDKAEGKRRQRGLRSEDRPLPTPPSAQPSVHANVDAEIAAAKHSSKYTVTPGGSSVPSSPSAGFNYATYDTDFGGGYAVANADGCEGNPYEEASPRPIRQSFGNSKPCTTNCPGTQPTKPTSISPSLSRVELQQPELQSPERLHHQSCLAKTLVAELRTKLNPRVDSDVSERVEPSTKPLREEPPVCPPLRARQFPTASKPPATSPKPRPVPVGGTPRDPPPTPKLSREVSGLVGVIKQAWVIVEKPGTETGLPVEQGEVLRWINFDDDVLSGATELMDDMFLECERWCGESVVLPSECVSVLRDKLKVANYLTKRPRAEMLEDYISESPVELHLKAGDIVYLHRKMADNYFYASNKFGKKCTVPANTLHILAPCELGGQP
ncbi:hypothetical protein SprV_0100219400 [Sparganum proliferum]